MSLMDEIKAAGEKKGPTCHVAALLADLDPKDAKDLVAAIGDPGIQLAQIVRALQKRDIRLASCTISRHRRGLCVCG